MDDGKSILAIWSGQLGVGLRAIAIFAAVSGAQLMARGRADIALFDALMDNYRGAGLFST